MRSDFVFSVLLALIAALPSCADPRCPRGYLQYGDVCRRCPPGQVRDGGICVTIGDGGNASGTTDAGTDTNFIPGNGSSEASAMDAEQVAPGDEAPAPSPQTASCSLPCAANAECVQSASGSTCQCMAGYEEMNGSCEDIDECQRNNGDCGANATCNNTMGRRTCSCPPGFEDRSGDGCKDVNDCATAPCLNGGTCIDGLDARTCTCANGFTGLNCEAEICGDLTIQSSSHLDAAAHCGVIEGNLYIASAGLPTIAAGDFPNLTKVTGDLQISASYATGGASPALATVTFSKLTTIEGALQIANAAHTGAVDTARFPELTTVGRAGSSLPQLYVILVPSLTTLDLPKLVTVHGSVQIGVGANILRTLNAPLLATVNGSVTITGATKFCNLNAPRVARVTGNVTLTNLLNTPTSQVQALILAADGSVTQSGIYCCAGVPNLRVGCEGLDFTGQCGC